jgi:hypothetical protein
MRGRESAVDVPSRRRGQETTPRVGVTAARQRLQELGIIDDFMHKSGKLELQDEGDASTKTLGK